MKKNSIALGMFAGLCAFAASQASATIVNVTVTGTITQIAQLYGGTQLDSVHIGDPFKAVYSFDTTQAALIESDATHSQAFGGLTNGSGPFGHVDVTIGNQSYSFEGSYVGSIQSHADCTASLACMTQSLTSHSATVDGYDALDVFTSEYGPFTSDFTEPGSYDLSSTDNPLLSELAITSVSNGAFTFFDYAAAQPQHVEVSISDGTSSDGGGSNNNPVPEPVSLSLFAAGLMGAPFFRRRGGKRGATACA